MTVQKIYENALNAKVYGSNASVSKYQNQLYNLLILNVDTGSLSSDDANYIIGTLNEVRRFLGWKEFEEI